MIGHTPEQQAAGRRATWWGFIALLLGAGCLGALIAQWWGLGFMLGPLAFVATILNSYWYNQSLWPEERQTRDAVIRAERRRERERKRHMGGWVP